MSVMFTELQTVDFSRAEMPDIQTIDMACNHIVSFKFPKAARLSSVDLSNI
jgi:hypothetical protein